MWFPRPAAPDDIKITGAARSPYTARWLFESLLAEDASEWREKVGVVGPRDGSAKSSTRLLRSRDWIFKTNMGLASSSLVPVRSRALEASELASRSAFWHPQKVWGFYASGGLYYPFSATPELVTLRQLRSTSEKLRAWTAMIELGVDVAAKNGIGLDLNPSNFGREEGDSRVYYIDDEWYPELLFSELAGAVVARIPEEPEIPEHEWNVWGTVLFAVLQPFCQRGRDWEELVDEMKSYPVAEQFGAHRTAVCEGIDSMRARRRLWNRTAGQDAECVRTAIFGDVHANLIALEAVLEECQNLGVDSYLFLGDAVGYGPFPRECVQRLAQLPKASFVRGNHDHAIGTGVLKDGMNRLARTCAEWTLDQLSAEDKQWLLGLPIDLQGQGWLAVHGSPKDPRRFLAYVYELTFDDNLEHLSKRDLSLCFCGHTHVQFVHERTENAENRKLGAPPRVEVNPSRILLVNPGSVGQPRDGDPRAAFAVWDRKKNAISLHRAPYAIDRVVQALTNAGLSARLGDRLSQAV